MFFNATLVVSACDKYEKVAPDHRDIAYDPEDQRLAKNEGYNTSNGNAVSIIAKIMGVEEDEGVNYLADPKFHEQLREAIRVNGHAWLKTDAATREAGGMFYGDCNGIFTNRAYNHSCGYFFRAELRVKKV